MPAKMSSKLICCNIIVIIAYYIIVGLKPGVDVLSFAQRVQYVK